MKKTLLVGLAIGMVSLVASAAFAASGEKDIPAQGGFSGQKNFGGQGIVGSSHDLSNVGGTTIASQYAAGIASGTAGIVSDRQSRICVFCHHPHNSKATGTNGGQAGAANMTYSPLWNRDMSAKTFAKYNNGGFVGTAASDKDHALNADSPVGLSGVSLLCMSCHDGVVAMNAYSKTSGSTGGAGGNGTAGAIMSTAGFNSVGGASDMSNHHPMGFNYAAVAAIDDEIAQPSVSMVPGNISASGVTAGTTTPGVTINDLLDGTGGATGMMECVTCHDVHNTKNAPNAERFLWRSNNQSNFCLTCHLK